MQCMRGRPDPLAACMHGNALLALTLWCAHAGELECRCGGDVLHLLLGDGHRSDISRAGGSSTSGACREQGARQGQEGQLDAGLAAGSGVGGRRHSLLLGGAGGAGSSTVGQRRHPGFVRGRVGRARETGRCDNENLNSETPRCSGAFLFQSTRLLTGFRGSCKTTTNKSAAAHNKSMLHHVNV